MKKRNKLSWNWNGEKFEVGNCIIEPYAENIHKSEFGQPIVFYRGNVFVLRRLRYDDKCFLVSIFDDFTIWANAENVFQVLKIY